MTPSACPGRSAACHTVIARLDRATQYAALFAIILYASEYWVPAFAGMTRGYVGAPAKI
jgi:hypothetical protein